MLLRASQGLDGEAGGCFHAGSKESAAAAPVSAADLDPAALRLVQRRRGLQCLLRAGLSLPAVLEAEGLRKGFGNRLLIEDLDFKLPPGGIVGVPAYRKVCCSISSHP